MDNSKPISIQNVNGNVTVTIVEGNNNKTELSIGAFTKRFAQDCGLRLIYNDDYFKKDNNTSTNFKEWLDGYSFNIKSVYHGREFRREKLLEGIKMKLEEKQRLLILGESGTSKSILLMEVLCDYLKDGYKIFHNFESGSEESSSSEIKNLEFIEDTLLALIESGEKILIVVDNVHNKTISNIFYIIKKIRDDNEDILDKIRFLLSARQPEFGWAMDRGLFDSETKNNINILFDKERRFFGIDKEKRSNLYFTEDEVKGFIEKYKEYLHSFKRNNTVEENTREIFKDTEGHPIMVRFSILQDGLENHVMQMYVDYLLENNIPNIERIKSVFACSLYHISSIPLTEDELFTKLGLKRSSLEIINTMIKRTNNIWTTIHPRWDLELFKYMFSLNEADRGEIENAFKTIFLKILEIERGQLNQLLILNTVYNTIAVEKFIDINKILDLIKLKEIENKLDNDSKIIFLANIIGVILYDLSKYEEAIECFDKALNINPQYIAALNNKGNALSALSRNEEAITYFNRTIKIDPYDAFAHNNKGIALYYLGRYEKTIICYDKAIDINPQYSNAYYNKGLAQVALGRYEEAIECFDKALKINPQYIAALNNKGNVLYQLGRKEEAIECYDRVIELNYQYSKAYINKGNMLLELGRYNEALDCFTTFQNYVPKNLDGLVGKAYSLTNLNEISAAKYLIEEILSIDPNNKSALKLKEMIE